MANLRKPTSGGKRATVATISAGGTNPPFSNPTMDAQQVLQTINNGDTVSFNNFMALSDDEKADAIEAIMKQDVPNFLDKGDFQKLLYYTEFEGKPQILSDSALDKVKGKSLYRTVSDVYDRKTDVNYTSKQIYNQIAKGDYTMVSSSGGSAYGKGIYFADSYRGSTVYGNGSRSLVMRAKLNSNARTIDYWRAVSGYSAERSSGSKLGRALSKLNSHDAISVYAVAKGYNVIQASNGYHVILDRSAISMSAKTKQATGTSW